MNIIRFMIILFFAGLIGLHGLSQPLPSSDATLDPYIKYKLPNKTEQPSDSSLSKVEFRTINLSEKDKRCLTKNIYWEARGEPVKGLKMVARVVFNRVKDDRWPDSVCGVIKDPKQFSWTHNLRWDRPLRNRTSVHRIRMIIDHFDNSGYWVENKPSHHYHKKNINWKYSGEYEKLQDIGNHRFYL